MNLPTNNFISGWFRMRIHKKISQLFRYAIKYLPLAAILITGVLPLSASARHWLIAATLIWFQVFIIFEVFGK